MCLDTLYRFIFNSDYPTDKVIYLEEGTVTLTPTGPDPQSDGEGTTILQNVPKERMPFIKGCISFDNWQSSIPFGYMRTVENGIVKDRTSAYVQATSSPWNGTAEIYVRSHEHKTGTVKFRVWGVWAEDDTGLDANKNTAISKTKLAFNTDNNYPRLVKDGIAKGGDTVAHNLGKIPYIDAWYDYWYGYGRNMDTPMLVADGCLGNNRQTLGVYADSQNLYFGNPQGETGLYYYYRIYA